MYSRGKAISRVLWNNIPLSILLQVYLRTLKCEFQATIYDHIYAFAIRQYKIINMGDLILLLASVNLSQVSDLVDLYTPTGSIVI